MKKLIFIICFLLLKIPLSAAGNYPTITHSGESLADFIPENYTALDTVFTDFNKDSEVDFALVIEGKDSLIEIRKYITENAENVDKPRILIICFKKDSGYELVEQSNTFILRSSEGGVLGDPFQGISAENGVLEIDFYGGSSDRWSLTYKFQYRKDAFTLIGAESYFFNTNDMSYESNSFNFLTSKVQITKGNNETDEKEAEKWVALKKFKLKTFNTFTQPYSWKISKDLYL
ncbi:MAG: hypothetical protein V4642_06900 [Bacteroidota bacterium]